MPARTVDEALAGRREAEVAGRRVLVCAATRTPVGTARVVDVRPGPVATHDGDRVRLPLVVSGTDRHSRVAWIDRPGLDEIVSSMLEAEAASVVRFGDRATCRRLLGTGNTAAVERRLAATARAAGAALVTWTERPRHELEDGRYDVVVEWATGTG